MDLPSKVWERLARRWGSVKKSLPLASSTGWAGKTQAVRLWGMSLKYSNSAALVSCAGRLGWAIRSFVSHPREDQGRGLHEEPGLL